MITTENQDRLTNWLCTRAEIADNGVIRCIGNVDGWIIKGVVGFDNWNGSSMQIHVAGVGNWLTKTLLYETFQYVFVRCKAKVLIGLVDSGNEALIRFNKHLGFKVEHVIEGAHPSGALLVFTMRPAECRFLHKEPPWARKAHRHQHRTTLERQKRQQLEMQL